MIIQPRSVINTGGRFSGKDALAVSLVNIDTNTSALPLTKFSQNTEISPEAYTIHILKDAIEIIYADFNGRFYALQTLRQYVREASVDDDGSIECVTIQDAPVFRERGVMLDVSRNRVPTMHTLQWYIRMFAELRYNQLQLYTEHTFAYTRHEKVWRDYSPMTPEEIRDIDAYCRLYGIELIPNQNSFGHLEPFLKYPDYHYLAEAPHGYDDPWGGHPEIGSSLYPGSEKTMQFLENLYDELLPNFTSKTVNVGCDETFDLCQGRSKEVCDQLGMGRVYLDFVSAINDNLVKRGFRTQFWGDMIESCPELIPNIPKSMQAVCWWYEGDDSMDRRVIPYAQSGLDFQIWPGTSAWMTLTGRWKNASANISESIEAGKKHGASGIVITDWGDHGHWNPPVLSMLPLVGGGIGIWEGTYPAEKNIIDAAASVPDLKMSKAFSRLMIRLGKLNEKLSFKLHNTTPWSVVLIQHYVPAYRSDFLRNRELLLETDWRAIIAETKTIRSELYSSGNEDPLMLDEAIWCCDIALIGMNLCLAYSEIEAVNWLPDELPRSTTLELADQFEQIAGQFRVIWLQKSRIGGLHFSYARMLELIEILKNQPE